jgi:thiosulfate/3-mercaptopyruvate sulfurtransferase
LEAWQKVFISDAEFAASLHNQPNCIACHGGVSGVENKAEAHVGLVRDPSALPEKVCGQCHADVVEHSSSSLHFGLQGYQTVLETRGADFSNPQMAEAYTNHCTSCHTTCGQCHVSRPTYTDGGLIAGHTFKKVASIKDTCLACHGGRVGPEYQGKNEGVKGDVHWMKGGMPCVACHTVADFHGDGTQYAHRYDGQEMPACLNCHPDVAAGKDGVQQHVLHENKVACQVCHSSGDYKQCYGCHVGKDEEGLPYRQLEPSELDFKIGLNPRQSEERPWQYVLLRHIPATQDMFAFYGENLLADFDAEPTWKYTTPHNIQRVTPQNEACNNCHGNADLFLLEDDVRPDELEANQGVIVTELPPEMPGQ